MDLLVNDIQKFSVQTGIVKDAIIDTAFGKKSIIEKDGILLYREDDLIIGIADDVGYLCRWKGDDTILLYKKGEKCKVRFISKRSIIKTIFLNTTECLSIYTMLADYYEIENILDYTKLYNKKLKMFDAHIS